MAETMVYTPDSQANNVLPWMLASQNNGVLGNNGLGGGILGFLLGLFFGNGWNGFGGFGGGSNAGAGFLSNQINNDSGRELLMNAINSNGEASRAAVQNLATMIGQDFNLVNSGVQTIQSALNSLALSQAVSVPQIINAIQAGDAAMTSAFQKCCCENQLAICQQTNTLGNAITSSGQRGVDAIADLKSTMISEFCAAKERDMQEKIDSLLVQNSTLRGQIDNANQTAAITSYVNSMIAPIQKEVTEIANRMPNTVPVQWPALTAVNTTPYVNGGYYGSSFGFGNGINF